MFGTAGGGCGGRMRFRCSWVHGERVGGQKEADPGRCPPIWDMRAARGPLTGGGGHWFWRVLQRRELSWGHAAVVPPGVHVSLRPSQREPVCSACPLSRTPSLTSQFRGVAGPGCRDRICRGLHPSFPLGSVPGWDPQVPIPWEMEPRVRGWLLSPFLAPLTLSSSEFGYVCVRSHLLSPLVQ